MNRQTLEAKTRKHWETWLPSKTAELKASGEWDEAVKGAALAAFRMIQDLQSQGYQAHEAEEVALRQYVLLSPEEPDEDDELEQELREMEANYQQNVAPYLIQD